MERSAGSSRVRGIAPARLFAIFVTGVALCAGAAGNAAQLGSNATGAARFVNDRDRVVLRGNVNPLARAEFEVGRADASLPMQRMIFSLALRPGARAALDKLLAAQQDPASPRYHQWLTPEEFGARFGLEDADLRLVEGWLQDHGFTIDEVARGRGWINFSGNAGQVERAFATEIHDYEVEGVVRHANAIDPSIPRALSPMVRGIVTLHSFPRPWHHSGFRLVSPEEVRPQYTSGSSHFLAPADFATIYDLNSVYSAGTTGSGQTIAIVGRTDIALGDVQYFRSFFGLPANDPVFVHNGTDPGDLGGGEETEADLDVEWSGAVAKNATLKFVISMSTSTTDGVDLSAQYIVNNNLASAMSTSFGQCESSMGSTELAFYNSTWQQAASQGITAFVSSGDSGAAGCNVGSDTTGSGAAVSGLCSTPYNVCVGGSQFNDTSNPSLYWSSTNNSATEASALSYIPEVAWNESGNVSGGSGLWSSGGGKSTTYAKPSWQSAPGVPADGARDVPDVALSAAGHDGYLIVQGHTSTVSGLGSVGGTSASSPSFAGLMGLINQKTGARQGNANTVFYQMGTNQYGGSGPTVFHDITSGSNSVPGVTGFNCGTGYDLVTGLGTVDGAALINNWGGTASPDFAISASPTSTSIGQGGSGNVTISTTVSGGFNAAVALSASGQPSGVTVAFNPTSIAAPGAGSSTMTITVSASAATGTSTITVTGTGGSKTHTATVSLTVTAPSTNPVVNGGFETGNFTGWTASGAATSVIAAAAHSGNFGAQLGATTPTNGDSSVTQTFTMPASSPSLSFWYNNHCPDTLTYDWATVTIKDNVTNVTTTLLPKTCNNPGGTWTQVNYNAAANAGHSVTLTLTSHDDNFGADPTYTWYDDVVVTSGPPDTTPPTTSITSPANNATVSGTITVTASASDNVGVVKVEFYIDSVLKSTVTTSPYTFSWNTTTVANGTHTIFSKAYDAANNVGTSATVTVTVSNTTPPQQLLLNPGFESGSANWTATPAVIGQNGPSEPAHSGTWNGWMDGYGSPHTDSVMQQVAIPASITTGTLSFWLHIDTAKTSGQAVDVLQVQIRNSSGTVLATLASFSNLNAATGYAQHSYDVSSFKGQTIQVFLTGTETGSGQTSFVVDDFALNVQ